MTNFSKSFVGYVGLVIFVLGYGFGYVRYGHDMQNIDSRIKTAISSCSSFLRPSQEYYGCVRRELSHIITPQTLPEVMRILEYTIGDLSPKNKNQHTIWCHDIGHIVGNIVANSSMSLPNLISACGSGRTCGYGCIHGVVAGRARQDPSLFQKVNTLCDNQTQCYHGFGHAYAELSGYDMSKSMADCGQINSPQGQQDCDGGVFMEIFQPPVNNHVVPYPQTENKLDACGQVTDSFRHDCAVRVGESVSQREMRDSSLRECVTTNDALTKDCITGFIQGSIDPVNDPHGDMAIRACEFLSGEYKIYCFVRIGSLLSTRYGQNVAVSVCKKTWKDARTDMCLRGAYETTP